jgi:hypothetical protein
MAWATIGENGQPSGIPIRSIDLMIGVALFFIREEELILTMDKLTTLARQGIMPMDVINFYMDHHPEVKP